MHAPSCVYLIGVSRVSAVRSLRGRFVSLKANKVIIISQVTVTRRWTFYAPLGPNQYEESAAG